MNFWLILYVLGREPCHEYWSEDQVLLTGQ
jgi:hypothetical protein